MINTDNLSRKELKDWIKSTSNESVELCYQCGKCSAGCPMIEDMDFAPNQILRMIQAGYQNFEDKILSSLSIWLCLTCETCVARCPKEVDLPKIMDSLRHEALKRKKAHPLSKDIIAFHKSFLDTLRIGGRLYEVGLIGAYKLRTFHFLQDLLLVPTMLMKGKLKLLPGRIKKRKELAKIFERTRESNNV